jgi:hypothetical protein
MNHRHTVLSISYNPTTPKTGANNTLLIYDTLPVTKDDLANNRLVFYMLYFREVTGSQRTLPGTMISDAGLGSLASVTGANPYFALSAATNVTSNFISQLTDSWQWTEPDPPILFWRVASDIPNANIVTPFRFRYECWALYGLWPRDYFPDVILPTFPRLTISKVPAAQGGIIP